MSASDASIQHLLDTYGLPLSQVQRGDIGCARSKGLIGWLIRFGTRSKWNHNFVIVDEGDHTPETIQVIQAEAHGVELTTLDKVAPGGTYAILPCPAGVNRDLVVAEAHALLRTKYAFLSIVSIALHIIATFLHLPFRLAIRDTSTLICSAVAALALMTGGWLKQWPDLYSVTPAQIAIALGLEAAMAKHGAST